MKGSYLATCRECGAQGMEDDGDPAPGLCPECFERHLREMLEMLAAEMEAVEG